MKHVDRRLGFGILMWWLLSSWLIWTHTHLSTLLPRVTMICLTLCLKPNRLHVKPEHNGTMRGDVSLAHAASMRRLLPAVMNLFNSVWPGSPTRQATWPRHHVRFLGPYVCAGAGRKAQCYLSKLWCTEVFSSTSLVWYLGDSPCTTVAGEAQKRVQWC